jgi:hypothetical protein
VFHLEKQRISENLTCGLEAGVYMEIKNKKLQSVSN